jgi:hypothetical protein
VNEVRVCCVEDSGIQYSDLLGRMSVTRSYCFRLLIQCTKDTTNERSESLCVEELWNSVRLGRMSRDESTIGAGEEGKDAVVNTDDDSRGSSKTIS